MVDLDEHSRATVLPRALPQSLFSGTMGAEEEGEATSDSSSLTTGSSCCGIGVLWGSKK